MSDKFRKAFQRILSCGKMSDIPAAGNPHNHLYCYNQEQSRVASTSTRRRSSASSPPTSSTSTKARSKMAPSTVYSSSAGQYLRPDYMPDLNVLKTRSTTPSFSSLEEEDCSRMAVTTATQSGAATAARFCQQQLFEKSTAPAHLETKF